MTTWQADGMPRVAIVTVNYNSGRFIGDFLTALAGLTYPCYRLVVVDCASVDGSDRLIERLRPHSTIVRSRENLGFTGGNNLAVERALADGADYILFLNNDTAPPPDLIEALLAQCAPRRLVVPRVQLWDTPDLLDDTAGRFDWQRGVWRDWLHGRPAPSWLAQPTLVEMASLCCLLAPATVFRHAGLLDERLFMYYEDFDWIRRAQDGGYHIWYLPHVCVRHRRAASSGGGDSPFKLYYATRNRVALMRWHSSAAGFARFTAEFTLTRWPRALQYLVSGRPALARAMLAGWLDGYRRQMGRRFPPPTPPREQ